MAASVQLQLPPTEVTSSSHAREITSPALGMSPSPTAILIRSVEDERGWQDKDGAYAQGYEPNYWSRIKSGEKPAQLERIARLPVRVQKRFVRRFARALGMDVRDETPADRQRRALADLQVALASAMKELING